jgi:uncharacterized protein (TIGR03663 family)
MATLNIRRTVFIALALLALAVRLVQLNERPMHTDESINAYIVGEVIEGVPYHYDPQDRHGPTLAEITVPLLRLQGVKTFPAITESQLRLVPVLTGTIGVLLFGAAVETFGFIPCLLAALLFAFAPLPLYYSRYFIHETLFVVATFGLILAGSRAFRKSSLGSPVIAGACAAFMLACKETAGLHFVALALAAGICHGWSTEPFAAKTFFPRRIWIGSGLAFVIAGLVLFTWGGQNWQAPLDLVRAIPHFAVRAEGQGHEKHFFYYLRLLASGWSGGILCALAVLGVCRSVCSASITATPWRRFIAIYGILILLIYSAIPYKTPWLALNFWLPMALLIGVAMEWFWLTRAQFSDRVVLFLAGLAIAALIAHDSRHWVFKDPAGEKNPYAYAHTMDDVLDLPVRLQQLCQQEHLAQPRIAVVAEDPWPLPWYLRAYSQTGYWQPGQDPGKADFYITTSDVPTNMMSLLKPCRSEFFGVRPNVLLILWTPPTNAPVSPP